MRAIYLAAWFLLLVVAFVNGALRVLLFDRLGELHAHQLSCLTGIALFGAVIYAVVRRWPLRSDAEALRIGVIWLVMTVAFEFLFFHYASGIPWEKLLEAYDLPSGQLWPLVLIWVAIAPLVLNRLARRGR